MTAEQYRDIYFLLKQFLIGRNSNKKIGKKEKKVYRNILLQMDEFEADVCFDDYE